MATTPQDLKMYLSGGAANSNPALALGGAISTTRVLAQSITTSTITGITYNYAAGNKEGAGSVRFTLTGTTLEWLAPDRGAYGPAVNVNTNASYTIRDDALAGYIEVTKSGSLPAGNTTQNVTIGHTANLLFDDVTKAESLAGRTEYRCIYVKNTHASESLTSVKIWRQTDTGGGDYLEIGLDPAGKNGTAGTIASETDVPSNVSFYTAADEAAAVSIGTLAFGDYYPVWVKRVVPTTTVDKALIDLSELRVSFL